MECIGARNFAAMAVSTFPTWRSRRRILKGEQRHLSNRCSWCKVKASGVGSESCVVVKEDFADEEDYIKAGGSELLFVQMQQNKSMEKQSKLADKVILFLSLSPPASFLGLCCKKVLMSKLICHCLQVSSLSFASVNCRRFIQCLVLLCLWSLSWNRITTGFRMYYVVYVAQS